MYPGLGMTSHKVRDNTKNKDFMKTAVDNEIQIYKKKAIDL